MSEQRIEPHKVTKPIQLLAAWLVGLCVLNGTFLGAAAAFKTSPWASGILICAAVLNVPAFLCSLFLLQTKYRPEMQEDSYYATYLNKNTNRETEVVKPIVRNPQLDELREELLLVRNQIMHLQMPQQQATDTASKVSAVPDWDKCRIALNDYHPDFLLIRKALKKANIPVMLIFGSVNNSRLPEKWILAVDVDADSSLLRTAVRELLKFSFDGVKLCEVSPVDREHIYVGSYDYEGGYAPVTDKLLELAQSGLDPIDLVYHVEKNFTKPD